MDQQRGGHAAHAQVLGHVSHRLVRLLAVPEDEPGGQDVMYCRVLYCTVLYCAVLYLVGRMYCRVLYCTVLCCTALYCTALHSIVLYCTVPGGEDVLQGAAPQLPVH